MQAAQDASQSVAADVTRLSGLANHIPDSAGADAVERAISTYRSSLVSKQWPLLQSADWEGAASGEVQSTGALVNVVLTARDADKTSSPIWGDIASTLSTLSQDSASQIDQLPASSAAMRIWTVVVLGVAMLLMTTAFFPTRVRPYRLAISIMAALTSLLVFMVVEASNPYAHHDPPSQLVQQLKSGAS